MKKFRKSVSIAALIMLIVYVISINFDNLTWEENSSSYLMILSMSLLILSMVFSNRADRKK